MIEVSDVAKKELKRMLSENTTDPAVVLRLTASEEGGLGLILDNEAAGDNVFKHEGISVLVIENELAGVLNGVSIDMEDTAEGPMLTFRGECGCGCDDDGCCSDDHSGHSGCCG